MLRRLNPFIKTSWTYSIKNRCISLTLPGEEFACAHRLLKTILWRNNGNIVESVSKWRTNRFIDDLRSEKVLTSRYWAQPWDSPTCWSKCSDVPAICSLQVLIAGGQDFFLPSGGKTYKKYEKYCEFPNYCIKLLSVNSYLAIKKVCNTYTVTKMIP